MIPEIERLIFVAKNADTKKKKGTGNKAIEDIISCRQYATPSFIEYSAQFFAWRNTTSTAPMKDNKLTFAEKPLFIKS